MNRSRGRILGALSLAATTAVPVLLLLVRTRLVTFRDDFTGFNALGFLLGRFSGRVMKSGEHLVPEEALAALADQNIPFTVKGKATYEQQVAALRGAAPTPVQ